MNTPWTGKHTIVPAIGKVPKAVNPRKSYELLAQHAVGSTVPVFYDLQNPAEACLMREASLNNLTLIIGSVLLVVALCVVCFLAMISIAFLKQ